MLRVAVRGMSLILGLGLLVGGVWGPQFKPDILIAAIALILSATLSSIRLKQLWVLSLLLAGIVCLLIRITIVIISTPDALEMVLQLTVLIHSIKEGIAAHEIGIFVRSEEQLARARDAATRAGLPFKVLDEHGETTSGLLEQRVALDQAILNSPSRRWNLN